MKATLEPHQPWPRFRRAIHRQFRLGTNFVAKLILKCQFERHGHALDVFFRDRLKTGGQDHALNHAAAVMELKWEAVIQYLCGGILALAQLAMRKSLSKTLEYDSVIKFGADLALIGHNQPFV